jgi:ABC-2 type transport system ATP-binding protein
MTNGPEEVIRLDGLGLKLARRQILDDLRVAITGKSIGLLGPNGAGKTTLIRTLLGFFPPSAGTASVFGHDVTRRSREIRGMIGYMPEIDAFVPGLSAVRFLRYMGELSGLPPKTALERAHETLYYVGLGEARYRNVETFSLGMRQRIKLAQAIIHSPRLLIMDEPTNGLDPPARIKMITLIKEIRDSGEMHLVLSSHLLRDVEECCEEVVVLNQGKLAAFCNLAEERRANKRFLNLELLGDRDRFSEALTDLGCQWAGGTNGRLKLVLPENVEIRDLSRLASEQNVQIRRLDHRRDSLQDIFLKALENGNHDRP